MPLSAVGADVAGALDEAPVTGALEPGAPRFGDSMLRLPSLRILTEAAQRMIQKAATKIVIRVNRSPALVPKALWPPSPPNAPAKPPPRPRWISTSRIKNTDVTNNNTMNKAASIGLSHSLVDGR